MQGAHPEAMDMGAGVHAQDEPEKLEAKRVLNAKVSAYTLEAGVITHRFPLLQYWPSWMGRSNIALYACVPALTLRCCGQPSPLPCPTGPCPLAACFR